MTFAEGESALSKWLDDNAFVTWAEHPEPWILEENLIKTLSLPINLEHNLNHPFHPTLKDVRKNPPVSG